MDKVQITYQS